jgi:hypothetical protein
VIGQALLEFLLFSHRERSGRPFRHDAIGDFLSQRDSFLNREAINP